VRKSCPANIPAISVIHPSFQSTTLLSGRLCRFATSKSFASCAGVIFTAQVPNSISHISSAISGISILTIGRISFFPAFKSFLYLLSLG
jgi:hypothetical protein